MDAIVAKCLKCGEPLKEPRKLKDFCTYSCRGQHAVDTLDGPAYQTGLKRSKNTRRTKALRSLKKQSVGAFTFEQINSVTYRIDGKAKHGIGWLMEVAWPGGKRQRWVARVGNQASEPLPIEEAKKAAIALLHQRGKAEPRDWIGELNQQAAFEVDRAVIERDRRKWPLNLVGGTGKRKPSVTVDPKLRQTILEEEAA